MSQSIRERVLADVLVAPINDTAASPTLNWGGSLDSPTGTGIRGNMTSVTSSVLGSDVLAVNASGVVVTGTLQASGGVIASGALDVVGDFSVATNKFNVTAASGNTAVAGTLNSVGNFSVATNKLTVAAASGNTAVAGSLSIGAGTAITKVLKGVVSVVIPALLTATNADITVTITGAAAGDLVQVTPLAAAMEADAAIVGVFVSAANTVKIRVANIGIGTLTGSTSNFTYMVVQS